MPQTDEVKRGRGRPPSFPDQDTVTRGYRIPKATVAALEEHAKKREENINVLIDKAVRAYCRPRSAKAKTPKTEAE